MQVQPSDIVISNGRLYRVLGGKGASNTAPTHEQGVVAHDGLKWLMVQDEAIYSAGVRNVVFRDIVLEKPRTAFSIHYDGNVSRSYYPGAKAIPQEQLYFDRIRIAHNKSTELVGVKSPVKDIVITDCSLAHNQLIFKRNKDETLDDYMKTLVHVSGCTFTHPDPMSFITNRVDGKVVHLQMSDNLVLADDFHLMVTPANGTITWDSDIPIRKR